MTVCMMVAPNGFSARRRGCVRCAVVLYLVGMHCVDIHTWCAVIRFACVSSSGSGHGNVLRTRPLVMSKKTLTSLAIYGWSIPRGVLRRQIFSGSQQAPIPDSRALRRISIVRMIGAPADGTAEPCHGGLRMFWANPNLTLTYTRRKLCSRWAALRPANTIDNRSHIPYLHTQGARRGQPCCRGGEIQNWQGWE